MSQITVSAVAAGFYLQANGAELHAAIAQAFDTVTLEKGEFHQYNVLVSESLGLSLTTVRNRAAVAKKIQAAYALKIAAYPEIDHDAIVDFGRFLVSEMQTAHSEFRRTLSDVSNFLAGDKPETVQRKEAADKAQAVREQLKATAAAKAKKEAEEKAKREADASGTPQEPSKADVQPQGTEVGKAADASSVPVDTPSAPVEQQRTVQPEVLMTASLTAEGEVSVVISDVLDDSTLMAIIEQLQAVMFERLDAKEAKAA